MDILFFKKINTEKSLIYILIGAFLIFFIFVFYLSSVHKARKIELLNPKGGEEWEIGKTYEIKWKESGLRSVGIVLFNGKETKWIAKNIAAKKEKYEWKIYPGQKLGDGYSMAILEYPWVKGNKISYSRGTFAIYYPKSWSCDDLSVKNEWPYIPSDLSLDMRRVFVTEGEYTGDLGGLQGADSKCQSEAEKHGFKGKWHAFLGGDGDEETAIKRMEKTPRGTNGIYVEANSAGKLIRGATCHRLLGENFDKFLEKFSNSLLSNKEKLDNNFFDNLSDIWLGRINERSKKNCILISSLALDTYKPTAEKYTLTATCQNWTKGNKFVNGYPQEKNPKNFSFPSCYTTGGKFTDAVALGGLSEGLTGGSDALNRFTPEQGKACDVKQKLLCIEE